MKKTMKSIIIIMIMIAIGVGFIIYGINIDKNVISVYDYKIDKNDNYEVILKPNNFYLTNTLPQGKYYVSNSIETYKIKFKYFFEGNRETNINYNYNVTANLIGVVESEEGEEKEVWNRDFILLSNNEKRQENIRELYIESPIDIDYEYYNKLARSYEKNYGIVINSVLKVCFNISYLINFSDIDIDDELIKDHIELEIPINNSISEVKENFEKNISNEIFPKTNKLVTFEKNFYIIGGSLINIITILFIFIKKINKKIFKDEYFKKLKYILKYYKDLIVTIVSPLDLDNFKVIKVSVMEDLINVAEQTRNNILYYNDSDKKNNYFYVIFDNYIYSYELTQEHTK